MDANNTKPFNELSKFQQACITARPCDCDAPIAYTGLAQVGPNPEDTEYHVTLYKVNKNMETTEIFSNIEHGEDLNDLNLVCTHCGVSWSHLNPLFD